MLTSSKPLIIAASAFVALVTAYILVAAWLNYFPFSNPATENAQTTEPLVDIPTSNLPQVVEPGTGIEVSPAPTSPVTPQIPPTTDSGSGAGGSGQPPSVPPEQGNQTSNSQPTETPPTPEGDGQSTTVPPEEAQPTLTPVPTPTPTPSPGGGGGSPSANDDDDDGGGVTPNQSPTALDDSATVNVGGSVVISVLSNDRDPDGDPLTITGVTQGTNGTVTFGPSTVTYTHNGSQTSSDSFSYFIADPLGGAGTATVSITVNQSPVAEDDSFTTDEDIALAGNVLADNGNGPDSDFNGDTLTVSITPVSGPANGALTLNTNGTFSYTPDLNFNGADSFQYELGDGNGGTATGDVSITINAVDDPPVAVDDSQTVLEDSGPTVIDVLANDTDVDGGVFTVDSVTDSPNSKKVENNNTSVVYTPSDNFCNDGTTTDDFTYTLTPGGSVATVRMSVTCAPDPPLAGVDDYTSVGNTVLEVGLALTRSLSE